MICCPLCAASARVKGDGYICNLCAHRFSQKEALHRDRKPHRGPSKVTAAKPEKYHGQPAGRIVIGRGSYWGAGA